MRDLSGAPSECAPLDRLLRFPLLPPPVAQIYFVGASGRWGWVPAEEYAAAKPDPLAEAAPGLIEHMNRDHAAALRDISRHFGNVPADEVVMV